MRRAVATFAVYALLSVALDAAILLCLPHGKGGQDALVMIASLMILQALIAFGIAKSILRGNEDDAIMLATAPSSMYLICAGLALFATGKLQWLSAFAQSAASLLASATAAFAASAGVPASSAALTLSLAHLVVKLRRGDYGGASLALFFAFISALALLSLTLL